MTEYMSSDNTTGLIFLRVDDTYTLFLNLFINFAINIIIRNDGSTTPRVEHMAPNIPPFLNPTNVLIFIAKGPGVDSDIAINSKRVLLSIKEYLIIFSFIKGIIAYPPPKVKRPILKNIENSKTFIISYSPF